jgi:hypothetical protein
MNLLQIRTWFVKESGRYDLVVDTTGYLDNGANNYINAGQRMLDRMQTTPFTMGHNWQAAASGIRHVVFPDARAIKKVFATKIADSGRNELTQKPLEWIKEQHFAEIAGISGDDLTTPLPSGGTPLYYAPGVFRLAPESTMAIGDIDVPAWYLDYIGESPYLYNGVLFTPSCDESYAIETWGYFYTPAFVLDTDVTWWSSQHPEVLVMASQMVIEKFMRNTEGVKDWMAAIKMELQGVDFDLVEEDSNYNQMEG